MRLRWWWALGLFGCQTTEPPPAPASPPVQAAPKAALKATPAPPTAPEVTPAPMAAATPKPAPKAAPAPPKAAPSASTAIKWDGSVAWTDWTTAQTQAKARNTPICLVVYADWCPRCRELAPLFARPEVVEAAKGMVMVKQNADERPAWLADLSVLGGYVPRVFFFTPDGSLRDEITSGHPRYPYFYTARNVQALLDSMRAAIKG